MTTGARLSLARVSTIFAVTAALTASAACHNMTPDVATGDARAAAAPAAPAAPPAPAPPDPIARGKYLVVVGGCNDCHTPLKMGPRGPEPDMALMMSGHPEAMKLPPAPKGGGPWMWHGAATNTAFAGPWGISYAINLTPDEETGIGAWSETVFVNALKTGKHLGVGRPIMPPMPWPGYAQMTDDDVKAVFAYLKTLRPLKNRVPEGVVAPPPTS